MRNWISQLANRLRLTLNFFSATKDYPGQIHQCEFYFTFLDGDRSPFGRSIFGLWTHETDQPDEIATVPRACSLGGVMGSYQRKALVLGRRDARQARSKRSLSDLLAELGCQAEPGPFGVDVYALGWEILLPAYSAAFDAYPNFAPSSACAPWSKEASEPQPPSARPQPPSARPVPTGRAPKGGPPLLLPDPSTAADLFDEFSKTPVGDWNEVRNLYFRMSDEELGLLAHHHAPPKGLGAALKIALEVMTDEWLAARRGEGSCKGN